jgi:RNA polymerase sigma-70 factor (ECF subfamily)
VNLSTPSRANSEVPAPAPCDNATSPCAEGANGAAAATLGDVLYANQSQPLIPEREWTDLVRNVAARDQAALHALYDRTSRLVFTLALRISGNRETAEELTLDVFHEIWRRASRYDPANGTVLGWIMNLARSRAIDRVRFDRRKKRVDPSGREEDSEPASADSRDIVEAKQEAHALQAALAMLTADERRVIEAAFFSELTHAEVAAKFNEPLGTVKTRIRSGLLKLRRALAAEAEKR